jgi:hypothetical protein
LQARTPKDTGDYAWKAYQTYEIGSVVEWTGPPDAGEPASVVRVVPETSQADDGDNAEGAGSQTERDSGGVGSPRLQLTAAWVLEL